MWISVGGGLRTGWVDGHPTFVSKPDTAVQAAAMTEMQLMRTRNTQDTELTTGIKAQSGCMHIRSQRCCSSASGNRIGGVANYGGHRSVQGIPSGCRRGYTGPRGLIRWQRGSK